MIFDIRPYATADFEALTELWHEAKRTAFSYVALMQSFTLAEDRRHFQNNVLPDCAVWVATAADIPLGFMALKGDYVDQLFVGVAHQRRGVGTALINKAKQLSPLGLRLHTFQRNALGRAFYERHGFVVTALGVSPAPECEPDVLYEWRPSADG